MGSMTWLARNCAVQELLCHGDMRSTALVQIGNGSEEGKRHDFGVKIRPKALHSKQWAQGPL
jgi:hypothetical protein